MGTSSVEILPTNCFLFVFSPTNCCWQRRADLWRFRFKVGVHSLLSKTYSPFDYIHVVYFDFFPKGTTTVVHKSGYQRKKLIVEHILQDKQPRYESQSHSMVLPQDMFHSSVYRCSHSTL